MRPTYEHEHLKIQFFGIQVLMYFLLLKLAHYSILIYCYMLHPMTSKGEPYVKKYCRWGNKGVCVRCLFKPDPRVYQIAVDELRVNPEEIVFQSSNAWDASGASAFGFKVAWVNRFGQSEERLPGRPDIEIRNLSELPDLLN